MATMTMEEEIKLINLVQQFPQLYNREHKDYKNDFITDSNWRIISRKIDRSKNDCKEKWKHFRKRYTQTGNGSWRHKHDLAFLEPFIRRRKVSNKSCSDPQTGIQDDIVEFVDLDSPKFKESTERSSVTFSDSETQRKKRKLNMVDFDNAQPQKKNCDNFLLDISTWTEKQSVKSFCDSLCNDLSSMSAEELLKCRIDILVIIQKYLMKPKNNVADASSDGSQNTKSFAVELSKHFSQIEKKLCGGEMPLHDEGWLLIYSIRSILYKLIELQKQNDELRDLFRNFQLLDHKSGHGTRSEEVGISESVPRVQNPVNWQPSFIDSQQVKHATSITKEGMSDFQACEEENFVSTSSELNLHPVEVSNRSEENSIINGSRGDASVCKMMILTTGLERISKYSSKPKKYLCTVCDVKLRSNEDMDVHLAKESHITAMEDRRETTAMRNLDLRIFNFSQEGWLKCVLCDKNVSSYNAFKQHLPGFNHQKLLKSFWVNHKVEPKDEDFVSSSVVRIKENSFFCLVCNLIFDDVNTHTLTREHIQKDAEISMFCLLGNFVHCFICRQNFISSKYRTHKMSKSHLEGKEFYLRKLCL